VKRLAHSTLLDTSYTCDQNNNSHSAPVRWVAKYRNICGVAWRMRRAGRRQVRVSSAYQSTNQSFISYNKKTLKLVEETTGKQTKEYC